MLAGYPLDASLLERRTLLLHLVELPLEVRVDDGLSRVDCLFDLIFLDSDDLVDVLGNLADVLHLGIGCHVVVHDDFVETFTLDSFQVRLI